MDEGVHYMKCSLILRMEEVLYEMKCGRSVFIFVFKSNYNLLQTFQTPL